MRVRAYFDSVFELKHTLAYRYDLLPYAIMCIGNPILDLYSAIGMKSHDHGVGHEAFVCVTPIIYVCIIICICICHVCILFCFAHTFAVAT